MSELAKLLEKLVEGAEDEEFIPTLFPNVTIFRINRRLQRAPNMSHPCIIVIGQGQKMGYLGNETFSFDEENYLVISQPLPFQCETVASPDHPVLGVSIAVDLETLHDLVAKIAIRPHREEQTEANPLRGMGSVPLDGEMTDSIERLLKSLICPNEIRLLGSCRLREVIYRALCGAYGPALFAVVDHNTNFERIARVLRHIQDNFSSQLSVEILAKMANMGVSAFHKAFRDTTLESPIQFIKNVRLNKARELIIHQGLRTNEVTNLVGYTSTSQFSREYKRYFGYPPSKTVK